MSSSQKDWKSALGQLFDQMPEEEKEKLKEEETAEPEEEPWQPGDEAALVYKDTKKRRGKVVTIVEGIDAPDDVLEKLTKDLKTDCGTGGSFKDGQIIIQGDFRDKVQKLLKTRGFKVKMR